MTFRTANITLVFGLLLAFVTVAVQGGVQLKSRQSAAGVPSNSYSGVSGDISDVSSGRHNTEMNSRYVDSGARPRLCKNHFEYIDVNVSINLEGL
jgi:hypothetical protein